METFAVNVNDLIAGKAKDDSGKSLILGAKSGELGWQADSSLVTGRLLQSNPAVGLARNFSCSQWVYACSFNLTPTPSLILFNNTGGLSETPVWALYTGFHPPTSCSCSNQTSGNVSLYDQWSSGNSSIAAITAGALTSSSTWSGAGVGTTTSTFAGTTHFSAGGSLMCQAAQPAKVGPVVSAVSPNAGVVGQVISVTISGSGFGSSPSITAGSLPITIQGTPTNTSITANIDLTNVTTQSSPNVIVTANGQPSEAGETFTAQVPKSLIPLTFQGSGPSSPCPNGVCPIQTPNNGNFYTPTGAIKASGKCGVGRYYTFNLVDSAVPANPLVGTFGIIETPSNFSSTVPNAPSPLQQTFANVGGLLADIQSFFYSSPACLGPNDNETVTWSYQITSGSKTYPLTTVITAVIGNSNGTAEVNETINTP
jgi:hypothetical protein